MVVLDFSTVITFPEGCSSQITSRSHHEVSDPQTVVTELLRVQMLETRRLDRVTFNACELSRSTKEVWKCCAIDPFSTGFFAKRNHKCTCTTVAEYTNFHVYIKLMLEVAIFLWTSVSEGTCWSFTNCEMLLTMYSLRSRVADSGDVMASSWHRRMPEKERLCKD